MNFQMFKLVLEKAEEPEIKLPTSAGSWKKEANSSFFCFIDYAKAFDCVDHNKLWKILKEMGIPDHLTCLLRNLYTHHTHNLNQPARFIWKENANVRERVHLAAQPAEANSSP